jgi:hypothetical protein
LRGHFIAFDGVGVVARRVENGLKVGGRSVLKVRLPFPGVGCRASRLLWSFGGGSEKMFGV